MAWYIDFGLRETIQDMFLDPRFVAARELGGREEGPGCYWSSPEAQRMRQQCPRFAAKEASGYDLLLDWVQPYKSMVHSMGVIGIRCTDIPARDRGKAWNVKVRRGAQKLCEYPSLVQALVLRLV